MKHIGAFEAKNRLSALLDAVERGEEVVITRRGKAVARLVPDRQQLGSNHAHEAAMRIRRRAAQINHGPFDWSAIKADRDTNRP